MGLWLVKRIVNRADGTVRSEERDPGGSVVTAVLPHEGAPGAGIPDVDEDRSAE